MSVDSPVGKMGRQCLTHGATWRSMLHCRETVGCRVSYIASFSRKAQLNTHTDARLGSDKAVKLLLAQGLP